MPQNKLVDLPLSISSLPKKKKKKKISGAALSVNALAVGLIFSVEKKKPGGEGTISLHLLSGGGGGRGDPVSGPKPVCCRLVATIHRASKKNKQKKKKIIQNKERVHPTGCCKDDGT